MEAQNRKVWRLAIQYIFLIVALYFSTFYLVVITRAWIDVLIVRPIKFSFSWFTTLQAVEFLTENFEKIEVPIPPKPVWKIDFYGIEICIPHFELPSVQNAQWFLMVILTLLAILLALRFKYSLVTKTVRKMRGLYIPESMVAGSNFCVGVIPKYQIGIYRAGLFTDTFVGYAIRIAEDVITLPLHVAHLAHPEMVMKNESTGEKIFIGNRTLIETTSVSDLCYIKVYKDEMTRLHIAVAKMPSKDLEGFVSVSGQKGTSAGKLTRHMTKGLMEYAGSTVPGYSGAAYFIGSLVYGMHIGAGGTSNLGISYVVWVRDLPQLFKYEIVKTEGSITFSSPSLLGDFEENFIKTDSKLWTFDDIISSKSKLSAIPKGYVSSWAAEVDEELGFESAIVDMIKDSSVSDLETLEKLISAHKDVKSKTTVKPQGKEEIEEIEIETNLEDMKTQLQLNFVETKVLQLFSTMENRIQQLERNIKAVSETAERAKALGEQAYTEVRELRGQRKERKLDGYVCWFEGCRFANRKYLSIVQHVVNEHKVTEDELAAFVADQRFHKSYIRPEASDEEDTINGNGKGNFSQANWRKPKFQNYKNTLRSSGNQNRSEYSTRPRLNMGKLMEKLSNTLNEVAQKLDGLSSATSQK